MDITISLETRPSKQGVLSELRYSIVSENLYQLELGEYHAYGIQIIAPDRMDVLHDVSVCKKTAECVVALLNHYEVSPVHLYDVVLDFLP